MASTTISSIGLQLLTTTNLKNQQNNLALLNEQLGTGVQHSNLTDYAAVDARNILDFQNAVTQRQAYISGMKTVNTRLSIYDSTMSDIENLTEQAQTLASQNQTYDPSKVAQLKAQVQAYLKQIQDDLNQKVGDRYIYSGSRYSTSPVANLTSLAAPGVPFTPATSPVLPDYDSEYAPSNSLTVTATPPTGNFQVGNTYVKWSDLAAGTVTNVYVNGVATPVTIAGLTTPATTQAQLASNLNSVINQIATSNPSITDFAGLLSSVSTNQVTVTTAGGSPAVITPDISGTSGQVTWSNSTDGTSPETIAVNDSKAYAQDSVTVDSAFSVQYGVTSNDPGFQQVIAGLRLINAAVSQNNPAVYNTNILAATDLLNKGLANVQAAHAGVAGNINILKQQTDIQNTDINNLQDQLNNIQQVDMTTVGTQINLLQTQLQASYSATATIIQDSILKYL